MMRGIVTCDQCGAQAETMDGWCILSRMMYTLGREVEKGLHLDLCQECSEPFRTIENKLKQARAFAAHEKTA